MLPRAGDVLYIDKEASVQFVVYPILFRVIRVLKRETYTGWIWLNGYELDSTGKAVGRREIFVQIAGLRQAIRPPAPAVRRPRPVNARPVAVPRPRTSPETTTTTGAPR